MFALLFLKQYFIPNVTISSRYQTTIHTILMKLLCFNKQTTKKALFVVSSMFSKQV